MKRSNEYGTNTYPDGSKKLRVNILRSKNIGIMNSAPSQQGSAYPISPATPNSAATAYPYYQHHPHQPLLSGSRNLSGSNSTPSRTIYIGNLPDSYSITLLLDQIKTGILESVRMLPEKHCAFLTFVDLEPAMALYHQVHSGGHRIVINGSEVKVGWGKHQQSQSNILAAVQQGATRNVYLGNIDIAEDHSSSRRSGGAHTHQARTAIGTPSSARGDADQTSTSPLTGGPVTESILREDLGKYGTIEHIKLLKEKRCAFVHFLSIASAIRCVRELPCEPGWSPPRKINYGRDRCAPPSGSGGGGGGGGISSSSNSSSTGNSGNANKAGVLALPMQQGFGQMGMVTTVPMSMSNTVSTSASDLVLDPAMAVAINPMQNRCIYLGNLHPDTTTEDLCNAIRGGILQHIRHIKDKRIAFATFIDPNAATAFFHLAHCLPQGLMVKNRKLRVSWGKQTTNVPHSILQAVQQGASRNVYLGALSLDVTEERLRSDFEPFGDIELVNLLRDKRCGFVNFTDISSAIQVVEAMRSPDREVKLANGAIFTKPEGYENVRVNYGKDRCGNPPRPPKSMALSGFGGPGGQDSMMTAGFANLNALPMYHPTGGAAMAANMVGGMDMGYGMPLDYTAMFPADGGSVMTAGGGMPMGYGQDEYQNTQLYYYYQHHQMQQQQQQQQQQQHQYGIGGSDSKNSSTIAGTGGVDGSGGSMPPTPIQGTAGYGGYGMDPSLVMGMTGGYYANNNNNGGNDGNGTSIGTATNNGSGYLQNY